MKVGNWNRTIWLATVIIVPVLMIGSASAQTPWTTVSGTSNISNTNSGTVAVASQGYSPSDGAGSSTLEVVGSGKCTDSAILSLTHVWGARRYLFNIRATGVSNYTAALAFDVSTYNGSVLTREAMRIDSSGNVGIGTTSPGVKLHVSNGASSRTQVTLSDNNTASLMLSAGNSQPGTVASDVSLRFRTGANYLNADSGGVTAMTIDTSGNVGIGTTSPINGGGAARWLTIDGSPYSGGVAYSVNGTPKGYTYYDNSVGAMSMQSASGVPLALTINGTSALFIDSSRNVGIGKTNPTVALDVVGSINLTGTINAKYQDVAEWVPSSERLAPGTVVVLDATKSNQVTSSTVSYDTRVAGVVSEQPGLALGEKSESKILVATTGRVRVKVDASKGAIHIGDLLVTSDIPGVAMKSEPVNLGGVQLHRPGTLIGKALEPLEKGKGEILVLLSLQ